MRKIVIPNNEEQINLTKDLVDGYIIGIKSMSVNTTYNIDINELDSLDYSKEIFISLNKHMENRDLDYLKEILIKLKDYPIKGVLYSDVSFINFKKNLNLSYDLVWSHEHFTTNYETINYWYSFGVNYTYLSNDITLEDVLKIRDNSKVKLMVNIFGYLPMFVSKRHIVQNYLNYFNIKDNSQINYIKKENEVYPIIDNDIGTFVYSSYIFNGLKEYYNLLDKGIDYIVINGFQIDDGKFKEVMDIINNIKRDSIIKKCEYIDSLFDNTDNAFMYQDTVSRVKKHG